jgi:hypothetical protein
MLHADNALLLLLLMSLPVVIGTRHLLPSSPSCAPPLSRPTLTRSEQALLNRHCSCQACVSCVTIRAPHTPVELQSYEQRVFMFLLSRCTD